MEEKLKCARDNLWISHENDLWRLFRINVLEEELPYVLESRTRKQIEAWIKKYEKTKKELEKV